LEILDFTINSLRELESELDRLSNCLSVVAEKQSEGTKVLRERLMRMEESAAELEKEIAKLKNIIFSSSAKSAFKQEKTVNSPLELEYGPRVTLNCKEWEDFRACACQAQIVTFERKEIEGRFRASALKNNQLVTYEGSLPTLPALLKAWLSEQLKIDSANGNTVVAAGSISFQK